MTTAPALQEIDAETQIFTPPNATDKRMSTVEILEEFEWILPFTDPESAAARVGTSLGTIKTYYKRTGRIVPKRLKPEPSHGLTILRGPR